MLRLTRLVGHHTYGVLFGLYLKSKRTLVARVHSGKYYPNTPIYAFNIEMLSGGVTEKYLCLLILFVFITSLDAPRTEQYLLLHHQEATASSMAFHEISGARAGTRPH